MFALSCAWNKWRHTDARSMVREIKDEFGINCLELSFALTKDFLRDIIPMKDAGEIEITSLHNFCPIPDGVDLRKAGPDCYSLASLDSEERAKGIEAAKATILTAQRFKAPAAILHLGKVDIKDRTKELASLVGSKAEYESLKAEMTEERKAHSAPFFDKVIASLKELGEFAKNAGVVLGLETRYYYNEIPTLEEFEIIFRQFNDEHIAYWHDAGHAQLFENIGLARHKDYLDKFKERLAGMHLHDIKGIEDHLAPLQGELDFSILAPYINEKTHLVLEPHKPAAAEDIRKGIKHLEKLFKRSRES